jgi:hypothetical protein
MLDDAVRFGGTCDGCGASDVSLMKVSLGKDYFGRVYDRLSPNADATPKWYCDPCSMEKNLQRDYRDIQTEFAKLNKGETSALQQPEQLQRAALRLKEITALLTGTRLKPTLVKPDEVSILARSLETHRTGSPA